MTTVKITELTNIGANLTSSTLVPVVNMAGTPTTQKATFGNIANIILEGAGVDYPEASVALLAQTVSNAAQPNITSTGTLTNLSVSGNANVGILNVSGTSNLGAVANVYIAGGADGYVLQTDGAGNLTWTAQTGGGGNGVPGGANTQVQFNDAGSFGGEGNFTYDSANHILNVTRANASFLTAYESVSTANISANGIANIARINVTNTANLGAVGNVTITGGSAGQKLTTDGAGNLSWTNDANSSYGNSNVASYLPTYTGNIGANVVNANAVYFTGNTFAEDDIEGTGNFGFETPANVGFGILTNAGNSEWTFGSDGNLTTPSNLVIGANSGGGSSIYQFDAPLQVIGEGANSAVVVGWTANSSGPEDVVAIAFNNPLATGASNLVIGVGNNATTVNYWNFDNTGNLTLPGNTFAVNYANGQQVPLGGGGANTGNVTFDNINIIGTGNLNLQPDPANSGSYLDIFLSSGPDIHIVASAGANLILGKDDQSNVMTSWDGNVYIQSWDNNTNTQGGVWSFGGNGILTLAGGINSKPSGFPFSDEITNITTGNPTVVVTVSTSVFPDPVTGQVTISGVIGTNEANDTWYYQAVNEDQFQLFSDAACTVPVDGTSWTAYVSGGNAYASQFSSLAISTNGLQVVAGGESWAFDNTGQINLPTESNSFNKGRIQSANGYPTLLAYGSSGEHGGPELDWMDSDDPATAFMNANVLRNTMYINDNGLYVGMNENTVANVAVANWRFTPAGSTIFPTLDVDLHNGGVQSAQTLQFGDNTQQVIITGPTPLVDNNAQRLIIQGQRGNGTGEGGDVYFWAGDADTNGGDIKIYAGDADNVSAGYGGYINIQGGQGFDGGGDVSITGGRSANSAGAEVRLIGGLGATTGGTANVQGGQGSVAGGVAELKGGYGGGSGGNVNIVGGAAGNGLAEYGNVNINAGASSWVFGNDGNLTLSGGGSIFSTNSTPSGAPGNTITLQPAGSGITTNQKLMIYPTAADGDHIHMTSGNLYETELFLGSDNFYAKLANTGDIVLHANTGLANATWTFSANSSLILPGAGVTMDAATNALLTSGIANTTIGTFVQGADGGISWEYQGDGADANTSYGAVGLDTAGTANTANLRFKVQLVSDQGNASTNKEWLFDTSGNLTLPGNTFSVNYANGTQVSLGGGSYGDSNVATFLGSYGSNTISTTGNISGGNLLASANVLGNGYARFTGSFDESQASTAGLYVGYAGGTPRIMFGTGNTSQTFEIDNDGGNLRFYQPGSTKATLTSAGDLSVSGNISATNLGNISSVNLTGSASNVLYGNGTFAAPVAEASFSIQTANFNANAGSRYGVNTSGGAVTATLPASPATGAAIFFADAGGAYASNNLTIARNGQTIMGAASDLTVSTNNQSVGLFYNGTTWRTYNAG